MCLIFSGLLYKMAAANLEHNATRQIGYFNNFLTPDEHDNYIHLRDNQLSEDLASLKANLIVLNLLVLSAGGAASYWLSRRTLQPIESALAAQSRFAADASHELRTPLTAIQAENEVALRSPNLTKSKAIILLKSNLEEAYKLSALSAGLLRLANDNGQIKYAQKANLYGLVEQAADRYAKAASLKSITINIVPAEYAVLGDKTSLIELFSVLIDNAIKYSGHGKTIKISSERSGKHVLTKITDKGRGIAADELPKIFDRFYRSDCSRTKDGDGGYGLGLAIASQIASSHKGHIEAFSRPGRGSSFSVYLPLA